MTKEAFCKHHTGFYGEEIDNIKQIAQITFNGEELYEYCNDLAKKFRLPVVSGTSASDVAVCVHEYPENSSGWLVVRKCLICDNFEKQTVR